MTGDTDNDAAGHVCPTGLDLDQPVLEHEKQSGEINNSDTWYENKFTILFYGMLYTPIHSIKVVHPLKILVQPGVYNTPG